MSWLDWANRTGTRSGNPNFSDVAREERRIQIEEARLEQVRKRKERQALLAAVVSPAKETEETLPDVLKVALDIFDDEESVKMVNFDQENGEDADGAIQNARDVRLPFNKADIQLWFSLIESKMQFAGLKKQWSKRQVLIQLIPAEFHNDFKKFLIMQETAAGATAYFDLKKAILKKFGPKKAEGFDRAISRVMTDTPSALGHLIVNDICPDHTPLAGCHCADTVLGIWLSLIHI